jgi:hypothetical protein
MNAFVEEWNNEEHLRKFAKPSPHLLTVKKTERSMCLTKMFDQAEIFRKQVRELEKEESDQAQARAYSEMEKRRDKLVAQQQLELHSFELHCARQDESIRQNQEIKRLALEARQTKVSSEIAEWTANPSQALPLMAAVVIPKAVMTPRTANRYSAFKKVSKQPVVTVRPLGNVRPAKRKPASALAESL